MRTRLFVSSWLRTFTCLLMLLLIWAALPPSTVRAAIDTDTHDPSIIKHGNY